MKTKRFTAFCLALILSLLSLQGCETAGTNETPQPAVIDPNAPLPAFPGAEGGGMYTVGGRGGEVYEVTTLADSMPGSPPIQGSLRDAVSKPKRTIVFRVSGTIHLNSRLSISNSYLTIAGQTAPGDGITVAGYDTNITGSNIIVRYMRFRPGAANVDKEPDALFARGAENIIIDHVSASWSTDETLSFYNNKNATVQWSIISESLNMSGHFKGKHGYGGIWGGSNASFHHNLLAHHTSRNPRVEVGGNKNPATIDMRNNVIYNWGFNSTYGGDTAGINIVNNYYKPGPGTSSNVRGRIANPWFEGSDWYISGNVVEGSDDVSKDNKLGVVGDVPFDTLSSPLEVQALLNEHKAEAVYEEVLAKAGATYPRRDAVDARIVHEARTNQGRFINREYEVGGYPELQSVTAPVDTDHDGMPDVWEKANGLDPNNPADGSAAASNRYTNLENYLNSLVDMNFRPDNPVVVLQAPKHNELLTAPGQVKLQAAASDKDGIEKVQFFNGDRLLGEDTSAPYEWTVSDLPEGTHFLSARAIDASGTAAQSTAAAVHVNGPAITAPWTAHDVGRPGVKGGASTDAESAYIVKGSGVIAGKEDHFQFTYQPLQGDGVIIAKVEAIGRIEQYATGGLMVRESLDAGAAFAAVSTSYVKADKQETPYSVYMLSRLTKGGSATAPTTHLDTIPAQNATQIPMWLKLERQGDLLTGYASIDGKSWSKTGEVKISMGETVYAGFAVDAADEPLNQLYNYNRVKFSNVTLSKQ